MKIKLYQIDPDRDKNCVSFLDLLGTMQRNDGDIDSDIYDVVFEGEVDCTDLEEVYRLFNLTRPEGFKGRAMSVSDIVEVDEADGELEPGLYFCDNMGFKAVEFEEEKDGGDGQD